MSESKLKERVLTLAAQIESSIKLDKATGIGTSEGDVYGSNLPEGITMETVKTVNGYDADYVAAGTYAFGKLSVEAMKKSKGLEKTSVELDMGVNKMTVAFDRTKEYTNSLAKEGEPNKITKFGVATTTFEVRGGKNSGELKKARQELNSLAQEAFGK
jgi:hypothetical protein